VLVLFLGGLVSGVAAPVSLGDTEVFEEFGRLTAARVEYRDSWWPTLTWLADKGFPRPHGLDANLAPYIAEHWEIVAIQLAPAQAGESLTGAVQPLRLSLTSDKLVYPMRLSRPAKTPQTVNLYVLADHRMDPKSVPVAGQKPSLEFAGP
jgi:hypothetical protein